MRVVGRTLGFLAASALVLAIALAAVAQTGTPAASSDPLQKTIDENAVKLDGLRSQIRQQQARIADIETREAEVRRTHEEIQHEIELGQQLIGQMVQKELMLEEQSRQLETELVSSRGIYDARRRALGRSLRNMYLRQQTGDLEMVLTAASFSDLLARVKLGRMLARLEAGLVQQTRQYGMRLQSEQAQLDAALAEIWQTRDEKDAQKNRLELLMAEQVAALRELDTERKGVKNRMLDLNLNEQKLTYIMEDLEQQREQRTLVETDDPESLVRLAGSLEWPVQGELVRGFGRSVHPRFKTVTLNNGVNIAAMQGAPVAAVARGRVEYSDVLPGFGQCVILDHGAGYYTLYAHLDQVFVAKGEEIARGQVVAEVGIPDGSGDPELYFEVRHGRTPLDPGDWLRSR